jgi:hypothetical protein
MRSLIFRQPAAVIDYGNDLSAAALSCLGERHFQIAPIHVQKLESRALKAPNIFCAEKGAGQSSWTRIIGLSWCCGIEYL